MKEIILLVIFLVVLIVMGLAVSKNDLADSPSDDIFNTRGSYSRHPRRRVKFSDYRNERFYDVSTGSILGDATRHV